MKFDLPESGQEEMGDGEGDVFLTGIQGHWYSSTVLPGSVRIMTTSRRLECQSGSVGLT